MEKEELISLYFEGKLSEAQEITFQQLMETDADFAEEVRYQENVKKAITLNERKQLKATLQSFETEKKTTGSFTKWLAAASIALVMISTYWYFNQTPDHNSLYAAYYQAYPCPAFAFTLSSVSQTLPTSKRGARLNVKPGISKKRYLSSKFAKPILAPTNRSCI